MQRKGICKNVGLCNNANSHKTVVINDDNEPFECPECHEPLEPISDEEVSTNPSTNKAKLFVLIGVVVAILIGFIIWLTASNGISSNDSEPVVTETIITDSMKEIELVPINVDSIAGAKADSIMAAKAITESIRAKAIADSIKLAQADSIMAANNAQKSNVRLPSNKSTPQQTSQTSNGKLSLSYGVYSGDIKNGYPDGMGRLTYSTSRQINRYDTKGRTASAGDYVIGEFVRGFFVQGKHYDSDGNLIETLMIGAPANNQYESK